MRKKMVIKLLGYQIMFLSLFFLPPLCIAFFMRESIWWVFFSSFLFSFGIGAALSYYVTAEHRLVRSDGFLMVVLIWVVFGLIGTLPFILSDQNLSFLDALFESISGITTTGVSVFTHTDKMPWSIQFYHNELQYIGGLGVIVIASALLPMMRIGGIHLYFADMPGPTKEEKLLPQLSSGMSMLLKIYLSFSVVCFIGFYCSGMTVFESVCEMFTTVSTGGFSLHVDGFSHYSVSAQIVAVVIMLSGAINYQLHFLVVHRKKLKFYFNDLECTRYVQMLMIISIFVFSVLMHHKFYDSPNSTFIYTVFNVISIMTTTGHTVGNFSQWPNVLPEMLVILGIIGGCAGSTSGGLKVIRLMISFRQLGITLKKLVHPAIVMKPSIQGHAIREELLESVMAFMVLYFYIFLTLILCMIASGLDLFNAFAAVAATISNLGVGINEISYDSAHPISKSIMILSMLIGRIEIMTFFAIMIPSFWRS